MPTQIRVLNNDTVHINGYVNAVDRFSRPMTDWNGKTFVEKIKPQVFAAAIDRADDVGIMLNHQRAISTIKESEAELKEDAVGLYFDGDIKDKELVEKARAGELVGWSFGFFPVDYDDKETDAEFVDYERTITNMELVEVTIVDNNAIPAYPATSIYSRAEDKDKLMHIRVTDDAFEIKEDIELENNKKALAERVAQLEILKNKKMEVSEDEQH